MLPRLVFIALLSLTWIKTVSALPCSQMSAPQLPPSTVDGVRPSDVAVLSSVGLHVHSSELSTVVSRLSELLSMFNPALLSLPSGETNLYGPQQRTLVDQAEDVSLELRNDKATGVRRGWKLVLLFVQVDRLCAVQQQQQVPSVLRTLVEEADEALRLLRSQLKRTIVSVALWDGEQRKTCMGSNSEGEVRLLRTMLAQSLQEALDELLVERRWYEGRDDFAVTLQEKPLVSGPRARHVSESEATRHTDNLMMQMWTNLLQPTVGQHNTDDSGNFVTLPCPTEGRPFLRTEGNSPSRGPGDASPLLVPFMGTEMPCDDFSPSASVPTSVHELRPADINVVAAVGDSLTAGNGIAAKPSNILDVLRQYRGLSWSVGGDDNLTSVTTLPNILKYYNHNLTGFSVGTGKEQTPQAFLNQAVAGAKSRDIPSQVRRLVERMKSDPRVNFETDWKLITVFIGGNDICDSCYNSLLFSAENYVLHIRESLDYLQKHVPRALVNLIEPLHIIPLREMHMDATLKCPTWLVKILCPCVILPKSNSEALHMLNKMNRIYQRSVHELVESGRYDNSSDFTVVIQPFFRDIIVPRQPDGRPDRSFFSADCFHLSQKAHTQMARSLWNNMLQPLGNKTSQQDFRTEIQLTCPTKTSPFIRTFSNSNYSYTSPPPPPGPIKDWGSDFSCGDLDSSVTVPTSVHQLRPADIKVVAALGDSLTLATGAKAKSYGNLNKQYKGVSWSIGGDSDLATVTTLPNILKKFNPSLKGFSKDQGLVKQKGFNMAAPGAKSSDILGQVQALIKAMREDKEVNFENDWKLVTIFVGGSDLCHYCLDQNNLSPKNYSHNLMTALDTLHKEVPRLLVNMVEILEILPLRTVTRNSLACSLLPRTSCPCVINPAENSPELEEMKRINQEYQTEIQHLISGGRYEGKEDFAVVLQPFLHNSFIPHVGKGEADSSFFSVDCFHISERAHAELAIGLWNNMLEPVGRKQSYNNFTYDRSKIRCPSQTSPFLFTKTNSLPNPPVTPAPTSAVPVEKCPSLLPVWVPVVVGVVSLLVGIAVTWMLFSCCQGRKNKEQRQMEMKASSF